MSRLVCVTKRFFSDKSGIATAEWVAVSSAFVILGIIATYQIFGDDDEGMIALVNNKKEQIQDRVDDVDAMMTEVNSWSPEDP